ncbi:hypothetical protein GIB67_026679 [Kingdonia uniflora]|uniref:50S ribosomal protein L16, chloroplastic n=1 Tax=Kingdonia uniflora TaxID=39325 RepID=A0A7J7MGI3_9MAGN|nr:hypothetical protein GIB67_026679 [Kingdonia uniflora]
MNSNMMTRSLLRHLGPRIFSRETIQTVNNKPTNGVITRTAGYIDVNGSTVPVRKGTVEWIRFPTSGLQNIREGKNEQIALVRTGLAVARVNGANWKLNSSMPDSSVNLKKQHFTTACCTNTFIRFPTEMLFQRSGFRAIMPGTLAAMPGMVTGTQRRFVHSLFPKRTKFNKQFKGTMKGVCHNGSSVSFGEFGLQALKHSWITSKQLEAGRRALIRNARAGGKIWVRIFPDKSVTLRPIETRMGRGKGNFAFWVAVVQPGQIIYEVSGVPEILAKEAFKIVGSKMPTQTRFVARE